MTIADQIAIIINLHVLKKWRYWLVPDQRKSEVLGLSSAL